MSQTYMALSDSEKIEIAKQAVAIGAVIPEAIRSALVEKGLYNLVVNPTGEHND